MHYIGALSLDKLVLITKYRIKAKIYLPIKPNPYRLRFYNLLCVPYLFLFPDNSSGYTSGIS